MRYCFLLALFICNYSILTAQVTIVTGSTLAEDRYKDYRETPYFFAEEATATFFTAEGKTLHVKKLRYNGFLEQFEVAKPGGEYVAIESSNYPKVKVYTSNDTLDFEAGSRPGHPQKYVQILFNNNKQRLVKAWIMSEGKVTVQNVGRTDTYLSFMKKPLYFFKDTSQENRLISIKRKPFSKSFGNKAAQIEKAYKSAPKGSANEARAVFALEQVFK